jgi:oxygen-dependent protoporphyrinogen oxidase
MMGLIRGRSKNPNRKRKVISSFADGMDTLTKRMAERLDIRLCSSGIRIGLDVHAKATVLAIPAYRAAEVLDNSAPDAAAVLRSIPYEPMVIAATSLSHDSLTAPLRGFGFLAPRSERMNILGTIFNSNLFNGRAPRGRHLLTSFLGGALKPEVFDWPEERVWNVVGSELKRVLKSTLQPTPVGLVRHRRAIPQYTIGHADRIRALQTELRRSRGLFITGNFFDGVSVPACMEHADLTAREVAAFLRSNT